MATEYGTYWRLHAEHFMFHLMGHCMVPMQYRDICFYRVRATGVIQDHDCSMANQGPSWTHDYSLMTMEHGDNHPSVNIRMSNTPVGCIDGKEMELRFSISGTVPEFTYRILVQQIAATGVNIEQHIEVIQYGGDIERAGEVNVRMRSTGSEGLHRFLISIWDTHTSLSLEEALVAKRDFNVDIIEDKGRPIVSMRENSTTYDPFWLAVSKTRNVAVTWIPKVMCTSIRKAMSYLECGVCRRCAEARRSKDLQTTDLSNFTRVIVFRDPFERLYSAYRNAPDNEHISLKGFSKENGTFDQFVDEIIRDPRTAFHNEHFLPQNRIAQFDKMQYHYLLRMSSSVDQDFFWEKIVQAKRRLHTNKSVQKRSHSHSFDLFQTIKLETLHKVWSLYKEDFDIWERLLVEGTPRQEGESTLYDFYKSAMLARNVVLDSNDHVHLS